MNPFGVSTVSEYGDISFKALGLDHAELGYTIIIYGERPPSWNLYYSGKHWAGRSAQASRIHWLVGMCCPECGQCFEVPVDIHIKVGFDRDPLDADNVCTKMYVDGLKEHMITDDDIRYVRSVSCEIEKSEKPYVEIRIVPVVKP